MRPALAAAVALALGAGSAHAQTRPDGPGGYGADRGAPSDPRYDREDRSAQENDDGPPAAGRGAPNGGANGSQDLIRQLNLRPDQQAAFRDYQTAFASQGRTEAQERDEAQRVAAMTTPQRLDYAAQEMEHDRADFDRVAAATRRLYTALDAYQRRTFDRLTAPQPDTDDGDDQGPPPPQPSRGR